MTPQSAKKAKYKSLESLPYGGCPNCRLFPMGCFFTTCAGKKHRNPPNFRKNLAKPARGPEPRPFWAAPRVRRMAREPAFRATRAYQIEWGPRKTSFAGRKTQRSGFATVLRPPFRAALSFARLLCRPKKFRKTGIFVDIHGKKSKFIDFPEKILRKWG